MAENSQYKQCPMCAEDIKKNAFICRYCNSSVQNTTIKDENGRFMNVKLKSIDKIYKGSLYVPGHMNRVSDVVNDNRKFISLGNAVEESKTRDIPIGFLAISKTAVEWICIEQESEEDNRPFDSQRIYHY
ncbi:MAG: hypothetical protein MRJ65_15880 [Candidatus Brocadiaceae bacterium]|nr:hypothetical protein [Candidatus Brocadiaceae bacterium]